MTGRCGVYELRRYALVPGRRDVLIELFDQCLVESQEELGMRVVELEPTRRSLLRGR